MTAVLVAADPGQPFVSPDDLAAIPGLWAAAVEEHLRPVVAEVFRNTAGQLHAQLVDVTDLPQLPAVTSLAAETYLAQAVNTFEEVGDELWETARTQLLEGFQQGESVDQLASRLRGSAGLSAKMGVLVARTQVLDASNAASLATARVSGIPMRKGWLDTPDERTREAHLLAGGTYGSDAGMIDLEDKFVVGGFECDRPHDPVLPPAMRYNCRCSLIYSIPEAGVRQARPDLTPEPALPNTSGVAPSGVEDLEADVQAIANGQGVREQLVGGSVGTVEKITLPDGRRVFGKTSADWFDRTGETGTDAEELAALLGRAINAPVPRVVRDGPRHIYTDWADGQIGSEWFTDKLDASLDGPPDTDFLRGVVDSGPGRRLGLFDLLTQNQDRHAANWLVTQDGILTGIDHGTTWWYDEFSLPIEFQFEGVELGEAASFPQVVRGPLQGPFVRDRWFDQDQLEDTGLAVPVDTDVWTPADVVEARRRLRILRGDFIRLGHGDWLDYSLRVLDLLEPYAKGTESIFDG